MFIREFGGASRPRPALQPIPQHLKPQQARPAMRPAVGQAQGPVVRPQGPVQGPPAAPDSPHQNPVTDARRQQIDDWVAGNATHESKFLGFRTDSEGGTRVGEALTGKTDLGALTTDEKRYLSQQAVAQWEGLDGSGRRENIREAGDLVENDPAARGALAEALVAPAVSDDRAIQQAGAIITAPGTTARHAEMFAEGVRLDPDAAIRASQGTEVEFAKRLDSMDESTRQQVWQMLGEPGRIPQDQQQKLTTALFFLDKNAKDAGPEYRSAMADAIALTRRPGNAEADRHARTMIASNLRAVLDTDGGRDMLLNDENSANARLWALNEVANQTGCIDAKMFAGFDAPALADAPGAPADPKASEAPPSEGEVMADLAQMGLDVAGIFDPTPTSDGINAVVSLFRGDLGGAALSAIGVVPYLGDLAKAGKIGKWANTVNKAVDLAKVDPGFLAKARPVLSSINDALKKLPEDILSKLPESAQNTIRGITRKLDDLLGGAIRRAPLVIDDAVGQAKTLPDGRTLRVGDAPTVNARGDGKLEALNADGKPIVVNAPRTYDEMVVNADGTKTYVKDGQTVTYNSSGFPEFDSKADLYLDARHIDNPKDSEHFRACNEMVAAALKRDPDMAAKMGLTPDQVRFFEEGKGFSSKPPGLTWHHHQDTGKMQLVDSDVHNSFPHTGGMAIWGGGRSG